MFVCLFVFTGCLFNNPLALETSLKTDWCHALQLTPRALSINQLPELGMEGMMFLEFSTIRHLCGGGWGRDEENWDGMGAGFSHITVSLISDIQKTRWKQVSENHVHSSKHYGGKRRTDAHFLDILNVKCAFSS